MGFLEQLAGWTQGNNAAPKPTDAIKNIFAPGTGNDAGRAGLNSLGAAGLANYNQGTLDLRQSQNDLRELASGQRSVSAEQLRQGLQQNVAQQQSMAASASPQNQAMAARSGAMNAARLGSGLAGQQAIAGLAERNQAQQALAQMLLGQRGQDVNATTGGYGGGMNPNGDKSAFDQYGVPIINTVIGGANAYSTFGNAGKK